MKPKKATGTYNLVKKAEKEMYKFQLNEPFYTVDDLIKLGAESYIPNLIQLSKKAKNDGLKGF